MPLLDALCSLYDDLRATEAEPLPFHPFVGQHFGEGTPGLLRVLITGSNCYVGEKDVPHPAWFAAWTRERAFTFFARAFSESAVLAEAVCSSQSFSGLRPGGGLEAMYVTNMVKRYLPASTGRREAEVPARWLDEGAQVWRRELDLLAAHSALPHVVIVFGDFTWSRVWPAFSTSEVGGWSREYRPLDEASPLFHHLNLVMVAEDGRERPLLLVKLTHPASASHKHRAARVVASPDFKRLVG